MQIELAPEIEAKLAREASQLGVTPTQLSAKILNSHFSGTSSSTLQSSPLSAEDRAKLFEEHIASLKEFSPGWETRDPYSVDWQAIKSEGRKY